MSDAMPSTADVVGMPQQLFKRVTRVPHTFPPAWEHKRVPKCEAAPEQIERECKSCRLVRITVMRGKGLRAYRWGDARYQFEEPVEPDCTREVISRGRRLDEAPLGRQGLLPARE